MARPRVLLVDDDASIRRFVALALEELDLTLIACASVADALAVLREAPVQLLLTDLMMPGESGLDLLQHLADNPALRGGALQVVFSAGLDAATRARLDRFDVWRQLSKPVSVLKLESCVREAVASAPAAPMPAPKVPGIQDEQGEPGDPGADAGRLSGDELTAIATHFNGDRGLFLAFRASCLAQFEADMAKGDEHLRPGHLSGLHHLAHSLKSVLATLGQPPLAAIARQLEDCAARGDIHQASPLWAQLRSGLAALASRARTG